MLKVTNVLRKVWILVFVFLVTISVVGCKKDKLEVAFDKDEYIVEVNQEVKITPKITEGNVDEAIEFVFSSEDPAVATYVNGTVKGLAVGETTIKAVNKKNDKVFAETKVKVVLEIKYKVAYELNGGTNNEANLAEYSQANLPLKLEKPTKEGHVFLGWFANAEFTGTAISNLPVGTREDKKFYAKWEVVGYAGGEEGMEFSFKYADYGVKTEILAAMERYLINKGASIPIISNSGAVMYSDRVTLPTKEYVPLMGYGALYGQLADNDKTPYRNFTTADPKTLNHLRYTDSIESDIMSLTELSLFSIEFNENFDGFVMVASAAEKLAEPVKFNKETNKWEVIKDFDAMKDIAEAWKITIREDLFWTNAEGTKGRQITADDFMYSYRMALDPVQANRRANYFYSAAGLPIKGAEDYFKQKDPVTKAPYAKGKVDGDYAVNWNTVGIHKLDEFSWVFELSQEFNQWDIHYNTSGFLFAPVYKELFEAGMDDNRKTTNYGSSLARYMSSGPYRLTYWENQKEIRYEKNAHYTYNTGVKEYTPNKINTSIVKDANAAIVMFEAGQLDAVTIPATHYEQYKNNPALRMVPGATSFRYSVNRMTQEQLDAEFGANVWKAKPILQEDDFMWALYFGMDRKTIALDIGKTATPEQFYFTNAYIVDPFEGTPYRETEQGKAVGTGIFDGDIDLLTRTIGYNPALSRSYYVKALDSMINKGVITAGTAANPVTIEIEIASFDSVTNVAYIDFISESLMQNFNAQTKYPHIKFKMTTSPQPGMDVYYTKQMAGRYDLAIAGISGGLLDPIGFLEVFCDDNRSGLLLSLGLDTTTPNILLNLDVDGDGVRDGYKYWSFNALYAATAGKALVQNGREVVEND